MCASLAHMRRFPVSGMAGNRVMCAPLAHMGRFSVSGLAGNAVMCVNRLEMLDERRDARPRTA